MLRTWSVQHGNDIGDVEGGRYSRTIALEQGTDDRIDARAVRDERVARVYAFAHSGRGVSYLENNNLWGMFKSYNNSASMGNADDMFWGCVMHEMGEGVQMDREKTMDALLMVMAKEFCGGSICPGCGGTGKRCAGNAVPETSDALSGTWDVESVVFTFGSGDAVPEHYSCVIERMASSVATASKRKGMNFQKTFMRQN